MATPNGTLATTLTCHVKTSIVTVSMGTNITASKFLGIFPRHFLLVLAEFICRLREQTDCRISKDGAAYPDYYEVFEQ